MTPHQSSAQPAVAEIAERLTEAQRWMVSGPVRHRHGRTLASVGSTATMHALERRGLLDGAAFTPLGLAVRAHLEGTRP